MANKNRAAAFALLACFIFASAARADTIPVPPELKAFLLRPEEQSAVTNIMRHQWDEVLPGCDAAIKQTDVLITELPTYDKNETPTSGSWRVVSRIEGCRQSRLFTVMYFFDKNGTMQKAGLLPGDTRADMTLQHDGLMQAYKAMANIAPKDCKDVKFLDTRFLGVGDKVANIPAGREDHAWSEEWIVWACGATGAVTMHFVPDATGTTIVAPADKTRKINSP